jgi:Flp pilus assembly protein TadD
LYKQTYPRDSTPVNNLGVIYQQLGQFDKAAENAREAVRLDPDLANGYLNLAGSYALLGRVDEAKATIKAGFQRNLGGPFAHIFLAALAFGQNDRATVEQELSLAKASGPEGEMGVLGFRANVAAYAGRMREAQDLFATVKEGGLRAHLSEIAANSVAAQAQWEAVYEQRQSAIEHANAALQLSPTLNVTNNAAVALAIAGQERRALDVFSPFLKQRPDDTLLHAIAFPGLQAIAELNQGNAEKALELLKSAAPYDGADPGVHYLRGTACLRSGHSAEAVQEYQKVLSLTFGRAFGPDIVSGLARLGLARAYLAQGDAAKARTAYQDLLAVWKDADADLPLVQKVKAEYAKLQ